MNADTRVTPLMVDVTHAAKIQRVVAEVGTLDILKVLEREAAAFLQAPADAA